MDTSFLIILIFSCFGLLDTLYISYHAYTQTDVWCPLFPKEWCKTVQYSKWSKTFGIPNGYLGFSLYLMIFAMTLLIQNGMDLPLWWLKTIASIGFLFSVYFTILQAWVLKAFCVWCIISAINLTVIWVTSIFYL